jgi:hypothetical protein
MIADKLAALKVDTAVWEEKREGYHRVVFSPDLWPVLVALVRAAEVFDRDATDPCTCGGTPFCPWEDLYAALDELDKVLS